MLRQRGGSVRLAETAGHSDLDDSDEGRIPLLRELHAQWDGRAERQRAELEAYAEEATRGFSARVARGMEAFVRRQRYQRRAGRAERIAAEQAAVDSILAEHRADVAAQLARDLAEIGEDSVQVWPNVARGVGFGPNPYCRDGIWVRGFTASGREVIDTYVAGDLAAQDQAIDAAWALLELIDPVADDRPLRVVR